MPGGEGIGIPWCGHSRRLRSAAGSGSALNLLDETEQVKYNPPLHQLAALYTVNGDAFELDGSPSRRGATEVTLVRSSQSPSHNDLVTALAAATS